MKQKLKVSVSKNPQMAGLVTCRCKSIREKILAFLLGDKRKITILIPGDNITELAICDSENGGSLNG